MQLFDLLDRLRAKPVAAKKRIAFIVSGSLTVVIFFFWALSFTSTPVKGKTIRETLSPLEGLLHTFSSVVDVTSSTLESLKDTASSTILFAATSSDESTAVVITPLDAKREIDPSISASGTTTFSR
jgi:hypothetical protein